MKLLIDQGNSSMKWCLHNGKAFLSYQTGTLDTLQDYVGDMTKSIHGVFISCVQKKETVELIKACLKTFTSASVIVARTAIQYKDLVNGYNNPAQLGVDRWLAMVATWQRFKTGFIIIDAGSALTLDIVDNSGEHLGGHIIPGLSMQKQALFAGTDNICITREFNPITYLPGTSTEAAVLHGCLTNLVSYIEAMVLQSSTVESLPLIITGGDGLRLSQSLSIQHELLPHLVLEGLYYSIQ